MTPKRNALLRAQAFLGMSLTMTVKALDELRTVNDSILEPYKSDLSHSVHILQESLNGVELAIAEDK